MLNEIAKGICSRIYELFGDGYEIYLQDIEQGLQEPCFFVALLSPSSKPLPGGRSIRETAWLVQFFPATSRMAELCDAADRLFDGLEYIALSDGSRLRGTRMKSEETDGILNFHVNYNYIGIRREEPEEPMEEVLVYAGKGGRNENGQKD